MIHYETRQDMLSVIPSGSTITELGVFAGDFAEDILLICKPSKLYLIDLWSGIIKSGNQDGNNVVSRRGSELYSQVCKRFISNSIVKIIRGNRSALKSISLNAIYIDADHTEIECYRDLSAAYHSVIDGGWIMGHDYGTNHKHKGNKTFGVKSAVTKFCQDFNQTISCLAHDGCLSFGIQKNGNNCNTNCI